MPAIPMTLRLSITNHKLTLMNIKELVGFDSMESAFEAMKKGNYNGIEFIEADYQNEKQRRNNELLADDDWYRYQQELGKRLRDMINKKEVYPGGEGSMARSKRPSVFISYSGIDKPVAEKVFQYFDEAGFLPKSDWNNKKLENVDEFIVRELKEADYCILLVSLQSMSSGWVGIDIDTAMFKEKMYNAKVVLISVDGSQVSDDGFYKKVISQITEKIAYLDEQIEEYRKGGFNNTPFQQKRWDMEALKNRIGEVFAHFNKKGIITDISGERYKNGMQKTCRDILDHYKSSRKV